MSEYTIFHTDSTHSVINRVNFKLHGGLYPGAKAAVLAVLAALWKPGPGDSLDLYDNDRPGDVLYGEHY